MTTVQSRVRRRFEQATEEFAASGAFRRLEDGAFSSAEYVDFACNVARAHLNSPRILAFLFAVAPPGASRHLSSNMLEELGGTDGGHPRYLEAMLAHLNLGDATIARVREDAADLIQKFCVDPMLFGTLRELGLSALLEVSSFEWMLSRLATRMGESLQRGLKLDRAALEWFFLHAEADIEHAEQALETIAEYVAGYGVTDEELETFLDLTFRENVFLARYFFKRYTA
jgi:hypothetical protein